MQLEAIAGDILVERILSATRWDVGSLIELAAREEKDWLEFKAALGPDPTAGFELDRHGKVAMNRDDYRWNVAKAAVAIANTRGGVILIGVNNNAEPVGLAASDPDGLLDREGTDPFLRHILRPALHRERGWKCSKEHWQLEGSLHGRIEANIGTYRGERVLAILVRPIPPSEPLILAHQTFPDEREVLFVRELGAQGNISEIVPIRRREDYQRSRIITSSTLAALLDQFEHSHGTALSRSEQPERLEEARATSKYWRNRFFTGAQMDQVSRELGLEQTNPSQFRSELPRHARPKSVLVEETKLSFLWGLLSFQKSRPVLWTIVAMIAVSSILFVVYPTRESKFQSANPPDAQLRSDSQASPNSVRTVDPPLHTRRNDALLEETNREEMETGPKTSGGLNLEGHEQGTTDNWKRSKEESLIASVEGKEQPQQEDVGAGLKVSLEDIRIPLSFRHNQQEDVSAGLKESQSRPEGGFEKDLPKSVDIEQLPLRASKPPDLFLSSQGLKSSQIYNQSTSAPVSRLEAGIIASSIASGPGLYLDRGAGKYSEIEPVLVRSRAHSSFLALFQGGQAEATRSQRIRVKGKFNPVVVLNRSVFYFRTSAEEPAGQPQAFLLPAKVKPGDFEFVFPERVASLELEQLAPRLYRLVLEGPPKGPHVLLLFVGQGSAGRQVVYPVQAAYP